VHRSRTFSIQAGAAAVPIQLRTYELEHYGDDAGITLFLHGGGWVQGGLDSHDAMCRWLAVGIGGPVIAVDYRLAPEHPFPAAVHDALAALGWAREQGSMLGVDAGRVGFVGDSAGATIACSAALVARDTGLKPPSFQVLMYPATDAFQRAANGALPGETGSGLSRDKLDWYWQQYLGDADPRSAYASPLHAYLGGLPATLIIVAGRDPLAAEGGELGSRIVAAGGVAVVRRYAAADHGFIADIEVDDTARRGATEMHEWIKSQFARI
jgi:acetyl esterase